MSRLQLSKDEALTLAAGFGLGCATTGLVAWLLSRQASNRQASTETQQQKAIAADNAAQIKQLVQSLDKLREAVDSQRTALEQNARAVVERQAARSASDDDEKFYDVDDGGEGDNAVPENVMGEYQPVGGEDNDDGGEQQLQAPEEKLFQEADQLRDQGHLQDSIDLVKQNRTVFEQSKEGLWRLARACYDQGEINSDLRKSSYEEGIPYAKQVIDMDPSCSNGHKWYAILCGAMADFVSLKEKVDCGLTFKKHVEESIRLDASDPLAHHLLGRFCFEVAGLSWWEKRACAAFVATPPESTFEEALSCFEKAQNLLPDWKMNLLFVAKSYIKLSKPGQAREWLTQCCNLPNQTPEDQRHHEEAQTLLQSI